MFMSHLVQYRYVSFDVFDTLIKRSTAVPSDIFRLIEQYCKQYDMPPNFSQKRIQAEQSAKEKMGRPVLLEEIYDELRGVFGVWTSRLMKLEIQIELSGCQPAEEGVQLYQQCLRQKKHIILISDMYLPENIIAQMLKKCGIYEYDKLFVSCEMAAKKSDGSLFSKVLQELGIRPALLLHIGDNWRSDFFVPFSLGIRVRHIPNNQKKLCRVPKSLNADSRVSYRTISACIENCSKEMSEYEKQGAEIFGPLVIGFTQWLVQQLQHDGITDVYFMARDGYTMKQIFDVLQPSGFRTHYMYCSRRSFVIPLLWKHSSFEEVIMARGLQDVSQMTIRKFLQLVGLSPDSYLEYVKKCGLNIDYLYEKGAFFCDKQIKAFYAKIRRDVEVNSHEEYDALMSYIRSCNMCGRVAIVDIGYYGTMQNALVELLTESKLDVVVKGYYVGVCPTSPLIQKRKINAAGYLYDVGKNEAYFSKFSPFNGIFETLFLGPHGSVKRFIMQNDEGIPEFDVYEYNDKMSQKVNEVAVIRDYQTGALKLAKYINTVMPNGILSIEPEAAIYRLAKLGIKPSLKEARFWGDFRFHSGEVRYLAITRRWKEYILHPCYLKNDFLPAIWKIGFMKRLLFLPLPYEKVILFLKKIYK